MLKPNFEQNNIPVVFASDDKFAKYLTVTLKSLICNSKETNNYDIYVLNENISKTYIDIIKCLEKQNVKITFVDVKPCIENIDKKIFYTESHFDLANYYRFFIPELFSNFEKVLYIDSDVIILDDIAKLYGKNLHEKLVGAIVDTEIIYLIHSKDKKHCKYLDEKLKLQNKFNYFNSGVMIFDIKKLLNFDFRNKCIQTLQEIKTPMYVDQCILNKILENNVEIISQEWNIHWQLPIFSKDYKKILPNNILKEYNKGVKYPKILHYAGRVKPWHSFFRPNIYRFWKYAYISPVFWELITDITSKKFRKWILFLKIYTI